MAAGEQNDQRPILTRGEQLADRVTLASGGGPVDSPQTFSEARITLGPMVEEARARLSEVPEPLRAERLFFEATVLPNYLANSHHPAALLGEIDAVAVGTRGARGTYVTPNKVQEDAPAKTLILSAAEDSLDRLGGILDTAQRHLASGVSDDVAKLQQVEAVGPRRVLRLGSEHFIDVEGRVAVEVVLNPILGRDGIPDTDQLSEVLLKWRDYVAELEGEADLDWTRTHGTLTFLPTLLPRDCLERAAEFNPLRTLRPMPRIVVEPSGPMRALAGPRPLPPSAAPSSPTRVALFDGGVAESVPALEPYVNRIDLTDGAQEDQRSTQHGTTVASAAAFGSISDAGLAVPPATIDAFRVWPAPEEHRADHHMYWVIDQIARELRRNEHSIVSLSIGPEFTLDEDTEPHPWTAALDELAARHGSLICVAAGNTGEEDAESGANRLGIPADLINGLSVGACDRPPPATWQRSPYSSVGPGRAGARVAPQVLACGGHLPASPFVCLVPGGQLAQSEGTSLAAPTLARALAELSHALGHDASANTLRACAVHFAEREAGAPASEYGYGRAPVSFLPNLECAPYEATVLYQDTLRRGQTVMLRVPLPDELLDDLGNRYIRLRWTLAFTSPVDPADTVDYGQAGVTAYFRPHAETFNLNLDGSAPIRVNRRAEPNLYTHLIRNQQRTPSDRPVTRSLADYAPETERRADGKWETIVRIDDRMQASSLYRPAFDMHLLTRSGGQLTAAGAADELDYSLLVTVTCPADVGLYDEVLAATPTLVPLAVQAPLRVQT